MLLLVGLGNPGSKYDNYRHNVGFMAVDAIIRRHNFSAPRKRFLGEMSEGKLDGEKVLTLKPQTYMNLSGQSVGEAARYFKIPVDDIIVFHDELDLAPGKVKFKTGGGAAGHNGLKSLDQHVGADYHRLRIGIGHPGERDAVTGHVLGDFSMTDEKWLSPLLGGIADAAPELVHGGGAKFLNALALLLKE